MEDDVRSVASSNDQFIDLIGQFSVGFYSAFLITTSQPLVSLSHGMEFTGIIPALGSIIRYRVELMVVKTDKYKNPYAINSFHRPLISVLRPTPTTWSLVVDQCLHILSRPKEIVRENAIPILCLVLLYLFRLKPPLPHPVPDPDLGLHCIA